MKTIMKTMMLACLSLVAGQNCNLQVPSNPLTAAGLALPWFVTTTAGSTIPCSQTSFGGSVYVEATIFDTKTNLFSAYFPAVVNAAANPEASAAGTAATGAAATGVGANGYAGGLAVATITPTLTATSIVGIWIGGNNGNTVLIATGTGAASSLVTGNCVNGLSAADVFGEYAYCNAVNFWTAVSAALQKKAIALPPKGVTIKGVPCPTTRSFTIVDQDQSDNVVTSQLLVQTIGVGLQIAQDTVNNRANLNVVTYQLNASDSLLCFLVQKIIGCANFLTVPNLADPGGPLVTTQALQELVASQLPDANIALVPAIDPMVLSNGAASLAKLNAYRVGVFQTPATAITTADGVNYCNNLVGVTPQFLAQHSEVLNAAPSLVPSVGSNMLNLLAARFINSVANLNCLTLNPNLKQPVTVVANRDNVVISNNLLALFPQFVTTTKIVKLPTPAPLPGSSGPNDPNADPNASSANNDPNAGGNAGPGAVNNDNAANTLAGATPGVALIAGVAGAAIGAVLLVLVALFAFGVVTCRKPASRNAASRV